MQPSRFLSLIALSGSLTFGVASKAMAQGAPSAAAAQGTVSSLDAELSAQDQADGEGRHFRTRTVALRANEGVEIAVSSDAFDTMVRVDGPNGQQVAANDDAPGEGLNSRVRFRAPVTGNYRVTVTSYSAGETGDFHMELTRGVSVDAAGALPANTPVAPSTGIVVAPRAPTGQVNPGASGCDPSGCPLPGTDPNVGVNAGNFFGTPAQQYVQGPNGQLIPFNEPGTPGAGAIGVAPGVNGMYGMAPSMPMMPGANGMYGYYAAPQMPGNYAVPGYGSPTYGVPNYGVPGYGMPGANNGATDPSFGSNDPSVDPNEPFGTDPNPVPPTGNNTATGNGNVYAVVVGISDYGGANNLDFVADDARNLQAALVQRGVARAQNVIMLTDAQATPMAVQQAFRTMSQRVTDRDTFVFFFDGHGSHNQIVLRNGRMDTQTLSAGLDRIRGQHLVVLDSCYSGSMSGMVQGHANRTGLFSSTASQVSYVASEFQSGGYLAWFLIQAIRQGVGGSDGLQVPELTRFVQQQYGQHVNGRQTLAVAGAQNMTLWGGASSGNVASAQRLARH